MATRNVYGKTYDLVMSKLPAVTRFRVPEVRRIRTMLWASNVLHAVVLEISIIVSAKSVKIKRAGNDDKYPTASWTTALYFSKLSA